MLFEDWLKRRLMLKALGVKVEEMDVLDTLVAGPSTSASVLPVAEDPDVRRAQVAAWVAASGGEVVDA